MAQMTIATQETVTPFGNVRGEKIPLEAYEHHAASLRVIRMMFVELDEIVADGDDVSDVEWASWSMQWSAEMGSLLKLAEARDAGDLTRYQEILLGDILALLERERLRLTELKLANPVIPTREQ
jgi:hypothetical protein